MQRRMGPGSNLGNYLEESSREKTYTKQQHRVWLRLRNLEPDCLGLNIVFVIFNCVTLDKLSFCVSIFSVKWE